MLSFCGEQPRWLRPAGLLTIVYCLFAPLSASAVVNQELISTVTSAVQSGTRFEAEGRWPAAIEHYEAALEKWPENDHLKIGKRRAQYQFAIERRYQDTSYTNELLRLPKHEALSEWDSVYNTVARSYIEKIRPTDFVAHGTESLYLGLFNSEFLAHHRLNSESSQVRELRQLLRTQYWNRPVSDTRQARAMIAEVAAHCRNRTGISETAVVMEYIYGGSNVLDKYSAVLTPSKRKDLFSKIDGELVGLGIEMKQAEGKGMLLVNVFPDSPADIGGARPGDHIVSIDGVDCRKMSAEQAANLLTGVAESRVRLELMGRDGQIRGPLTFVRRPIQIKSIPIVKMVDRENGVGYLKLVSFQKSSATELDAALNKLEQQGMRSLIWDVRGNPGGLLTAAIEVLDRFLDRGVIVSTKGRDLGQDWKYSAHSTRTWKMPLILLVDGNSASASEIAAGAIHDHKRGLLVGRKSYGKWSVQSILDGNHSTGFRLTTAKFYSPSDRNYSDVGIEPDVEVAVEDEYATYYRGADELNEASDPDVAKALEILRSGEQYTTMTRGYGRSTP